VTSETEGISFDQGAKQVPCLGKMPARKLLVRSLKCLQSGGLIVCWLGRWLRRRGLLESQGRINHTRFSFTGRGFAREPQLALKPFVVLLVGTTLRLVLPAALAEALPFGFATFVFKAL
jgi:hypothetical protein